MPRKNNAKSNEALFEEAENALIGEAIAETEEEIAASAFDEEPDENTGDDSLEQMDDEGLDGEDQFDEEDDAQSGEDDAEASGEEGEQEQAQEDARQAERQDRQQDRRGVPPSRLREESEARRVAEAETRELRARLEALERSQAQPQQRQQQQQPEKPDMFADPDGWARAQRAEIEQGIRARNVEASLADAAEEHGETFQTAYQSLINAARSGDRATVQQIWDSPNPGRALMRWHERQSLLSEIGSDPNAYRQKVRDELLSDPDFRKQLLTGMREDAMRGDGGRPRTQTRLPPSLNAASGGTSHRGGGGNMNGRDTARTARSIEQDIFESAFDDD